MIQLLIVDDEPLVQVGIMSMLNWHNLGIQVCGTATNGEQALKLIDEHHPELVITDVKMPSMNGLEMIKLCLERFPVTPEFIVLTSYEEFPLIKEAIKYQVVDYLIKMELNADILTESVNKALKRIARNNGPETVLSTDSDYFYEKFMIRLLNNLFESEEQFLLQARELRMDFSAPAYVLCLCTIAGVEEGRLPQDKLLNLYFSTVRMADGIARRHMPCFITSLDPKHFCFIFSLEEPEYDLYRDKISSALTETFKMVNNYFKVNICATTGRSCTNPFYLFESYQDARQIQIYGNPDTPVIFYEEFQANSRKMCSNTFSLSLFRNEIQNAFQSYDADSLRNTLSTIINLFRGNPASYLQAIDASCNLLYLSLSLLPDGENVLSKIFEAYSDGYLSIYRQANVDQILSWLEVFRDGLESVLKLQHKNYKSHMIRNVQSYIDSHIEEKLSLNDIASVFSISPNYLSILFKKTTDVGFTEYITQRKISRAKVLMSEGQLKIYEIADRLGFESAFYFSKVFKKVSGCSPRDYIGSMD